MARKSGKPRGKPKEKPEEEHAETKIITIRTAFIPTPDSKGTRQLVRIADAEGQMHQVQSLCSLEEDVRTFVAGRTICIAKGANDRWKAVPISPAQSKTAPEVPQPSLLSGSAP